MSVQMTIIIRVNTSGLRSQVHSHCFSLSLEMWFFSLTFFTLYLLPIAPPPCMQTHTLHERESEREMEAGRAAGIHLLHRMDNYFSVIVFELCRIGTYESLCFIVSYAERAHTHSDNPHFPFLWLYFPALYLLSSISITFSSVCFVLSLRLPGVCSTDESPSYNISHWFTATGIDLKQPCS